MAAENYQNSNACQAYQEKRTYSVQEVADMLQISKSRAYALCKQSQFKTVKIGKYVRILKSSNWLDSAEQIVWHQLSNEANLILLFTTKVREKTGTRSGSPA